MVTNRRVDANRNGLNPSTGFIEDDWAGGRIAGILRTTNAEKRRGSERGPETARMRHGNSNFAEAH